MWVYQQTGTPAHLPKPRISFPTGEAALSQPQKTLPPDNDPHPEVPSPLQIHHTETRQKNLLSAPSGGGVPCLSLCSAGPCSGFAKAAAWTGAQFYLQSWRRPVAAADAHTAASLFGMEYLTLLQRNPSVPDGLSALGPVLIFCLRCSRAGKRDAVCVSCFPTRRTEKGTLSAACIFCLRSCFCRAVHASGTDSLCGEQPVRLFPFLQQG